ncbi:MAG: choice-of-anchor tandem repeat GloVer-containing protein [Bryobacteraceae bacterium]
MTTAIFALMTFGVAWTQAQTYTVLHRFAGTDGSNPEAGLIADPAGSLFGTTSFGGAADNGNVFRLDETGLAVLYTFTGEIDGGQPEAALIRDPAGNLYGTTEFGGAGWGTVYKVDAAGTETVLHRFGTRTGDGKFPYAGLMRDSAGNLYGTTKRGGDTNDGTIFKLDKTGETVLHSFAGGDGRRPYAGLIQDSAGNLYGTTNEGGDTNVGTVFKLDKTGTETALHTFRVDVGDGGRPVAGLIQDAAGNFYGTTEFGGASGYGIVFRLDTAGTETVLYSFTGGADGGYPVAGLAQDPEGNLYGAASGGGAANHGVVYKLDTTGRQTVLYTFTGGADGARPMAGLFRDSAGNLYGDTYGGGNTSAACGGSCGVVFMIAP